MSEDRTHESSPGIMLSARAYISDHWKVGYDLGENGADYEQVMFLHGFMEGMRKIPTYQWESIKRAAEDRDIDLSELVYMMSEFLGDTASA